MTKKSKPPKFAAKKCESCKLEIAIPHDVTICPDCSGELTPVSFNPEINTSPNTPINDIMEKVLQFIKKNDGYILSAELYSRFDITQALNAITGLEKDGLVTREASGIRISKEV